MSIPTRWQYGKLHIAVQMLKITDEEKKTMVASYTDDPDKTSFSNLTREQAGELIEILDERINPSTKGEDAKQAIRRRIIAIAHQMGWQQYDNGVLVLKKGKPLADYKAIDDYCKSHTAAKKKLNEMNVKELSAAAAQFNQYHLTTLKAKSNGKNSSNKQD